MISKSNLDTLSKERKQFFQRWDQIDVEVRQV